MLGWVVLASGPGVGWVRGQETGPGGAGEVDRLGRRPVPAEGAQADVRQGLKDRYAKDYADGTPAGKRRLAGMLLRDVGRQPGGLGDAALWVTLSEVRDLAVAAGEVDLALEAAGELGRRFDIDAEAARFAVLTVSARGKLSPGQALSLARAARGLAEQRLAADDFEGAGRAATLADESGRRTGDTSVQAEMALLADFCREVIRLAPRYREAMSRLKDDPEDAAANATAAEFLVTAKQEWGRALVMLTKGSDKALREAARIELSEPRGPALLDAAAAWEAWGEKRQGPGRAIVLRHARGLYERAAEGASGADLDRALERVAALAGSGGGELADTRAARAKLGETRWQWWEGLRVGAMSGREDAASLKSSQAIVEWRPRLDARGLLPETPETSDGGEARLASDRDGRLTYRLRVLCVDEQGRSAVLEKDGRFPLRNPERQIRLTGPTNADIRRYNSGKPTPSAVHLVIEFDGVRVSERVWKLPAKRAWWLDEAAVVRQR